MLNKLFLGIFALTILNSCSSDNETGLTGERTINGSITSYEVNLISNKKKDELPDFPFEEVVETEDYTMKASSSTGEVLNEWSHDITDDFSFEATGAVVFETYKTPNYDLPRASYHLQGKESVDKEDNNVKIVMSNTEYAGIAIYSENVSSVSINGINDLPVVEASKNKYYYSFVEPEKEYTVVIEDLQYNTHTIEIDKKDLEENDMARIYVSKRNIDGDFEIIIDWDYKDIPTN